MIFLPIIIFLFAARGNAGELPSTIEADGALRVNASTRDGSYAIGVYGLAMPVLRSQFAVEVNHRWIYSRNYPKHEIAHSETTDDLGAAQQWIVRCYGLRDEPDLTLVLRAYTAVPFGDVQVIVDNPASQTFKIQAIRPVAASGHNILNLGGDSSSDRIYSDALSYGVQILDLKDAPNGMHRGVGSQLIYNRQSHRSIFLGALTSNRFLTILRLRVSTAKSGESRIGFYQVDSTGTTEMTKEHALRASPAEDQIDLTLPLKPGNRLKSERLFFGVGTNYHRQLETYGALIKKLHHARVSAANPMGWWSWTAYYFGLDQGAALTNADWLAQHLKSLGYNYFFIDEGYQYARGEYTTANPDLFPDGMESLEKEVRLKGLIPGIWTAPFEVSSRSWVYQHHKDWLVHNAKGSPIQIGWVLRRIDPVFSLDTTNPGAQDYLRRTYSTLVNQWGIRFIKLDFMVNSAIEGYYYRPNTTALAAQRIGLGIIRQTVGNEVLLDKDGCEMLNPVGYVDVGRISNDTGHTFYATKMAAPGIAARYYMNRNFFDSDPDAFTISRQLVSDPDPDPQANDGVRPLTLNEAQVSIALAAVSGGLFEIGDDLTTLGADPDRMALAKNRDLIHMTQLGRASVPLDLMSYAPEDEQPSIFLLKEDNRTSILTIFDWTEKPRTHTFNMPDFGLSSSHSYQITNILDPAARFLLTSGPLTVSQPARSVRLFKIVDTSIPGVRLKLDVQVPREGRAGESLRFTVRGENKGEPVICCKWDFGDGVTADGENVRHTYTHPGKFQLKLRANGENGVVDMQEFPVVINGRMETQFIPAQQRNSGAHD
jgi:alpha-galactosidase